MFNDLNSNSVPPDQMLPLVPILGHNLGKVDKPGTLGLKVESLVVREVSMIVVVYES